MGPTIPFFLYETSETTMSSDGGDLDNGQSSPLPRMPSPCELPGEALPTQSSSTKALSMAPNSILMQSSRRSSMNSHDSSRSFDIDPNADLIKRASSDDTIDINVEIQRILGEDSDKSTSSHVESSAGRTNSSSLGCTEETQDAGEDAAEITDSTKISPVHYKQPFSPQEDTGSLALIAAAAAAAISAPNDSTPIPCATGNDEQRQKGHVRGVAHSLVGDGDETYEPKAYDDASMDPYPVAHHYQLPYSRGSVVDSGGCLEFNTLPNVTPPVVGMTVNPVQQEQMEYLPIPHNFGSSIHPSLVAPTGVACSTLHSHNFYPPTNSDDKVEGEGPETKKWRRRRPKKKKKTSAKKQKSPFERRPVKGPGSRGKRGSYKCRLCGQAKAKHICSAVEPYGVSLQEDAQVQTETTYADERIALSSGIRVIAVRERKVIAVDMLESNDEESDKREPGEESGEVLLNGGHDNGEENEEAIPFAAV